MSTHASIAILDPDGGVRSIYVHSDGMDVGSKLQHHYDSRAQAEEILALGDLSCLGTTLERVGPEHRDAIDRVPYSAPVRRDQTVAYARDCAENGTEAIHSDSVDAWLEDTNYAEFWLIWNDADQVTSAGWWRYVGRHDDLAAFVALSAVITADELAS